MNIEVEEIVKRTGIKELGAIARLKRYHNGEIEKEQLFLPRTNMKYCIVDGVVYTTEDIKEKTGIKENCHAILRIKKFLAGKISKRELFTDAKETIYLKIKGRYWSASDIMKVNKQKYECTLYRMGQYNEGKMDIKQLFSTEHVRRYEIKFEDVMAIANCSRSTADNRIKKFYAGSITKEELFREIKKTNTGNDEWLALGG